MSETIAVDLRLDEYEIIKKRRSEEAHKEATREFQLKSITVANEYFLWANENNLPSPDSGTFVNQFGYEDIDHSIMRNAVEQIWKLVFSFEIPKEETPNGH